ncbi:MAG: T9SS type A sorting domain-containing protein [Bacteroidota bacterium]
MILLKAIIIFFLPLVLSAQDYYDGIPALFEDFSYTNTEYYHPDSSHNNSLFGMNQWYTENGITVTRAWYPWGWHDETTAYRNDTLFSPRKHGISLTIKKGFNIMPWLTSGLAAKEGTYVSRVRFDMMSRNGYIIQAFWFMSPNRYRFKRSEDSINYFSEIDFEWNNHFAGPVNSGGHVSYLTSQVEGKYATGKTEQLQFFKRDQSGIISDVTADLYNGNDSIVAKQWYYCFFTIDSVKHTISYYMQSEENHNGDTYYGGGAHLDSSLTPFVYKHSPQFNLCPMYSVSFRGKDSTIKVSDQDIELDIDWFYYSPNTNLSLDDVLKEVKNFRGGQIDRINTTGYSTFHDVKNTPISVEISGPAEIHPFSAGKWTLSATDLSAIMHTEYSYRFLDKDSAGEWHDIVANDVILTANASHGAIEFKAKVRQIWTGDEATTSKRVTIIPFKNSIDLNPFPNPTSGIATIEIPFLYDQQYLDITVYNVAGNRVLSYTASALYRLPVDLSKLPIGQYCIKVQSDKNIVETIVQVVR